MNPTPEPGLYGKFRVERRDGRDRPGGDKADARYFVLDYVHDPYARIALAAYADACAQELPELAQDLRGILDVFRPAPGPSVSGQLEPAPPELKLMADPGVDEDAVTRLQRSLTDALARAHYAEDCLDMVRRELGELREESRREIEARDRSFAAVSKNVASLRAGLSERGYAPAQDTVSDALGALDAARQARDEARSQLAEARINLIRDELRAALGSTPDTGSTP